MELDRGDAATGEPLAWRPASSMPPLERVTDYADVGRGTVEDDEALIGGRQHNVLPERSSV